MSAAPRRGRNAGRSSPQARSARALALEALGRIDGGAYANLVLPALLERSGLDERDRHFATELVYGTTRMRRACDFLVDRFLIRPEVAGDVRNLLRLGAYQLHFLATPPHAAVAATVEEAPRAARGLVNAVLRRVAENPPAWPDDPTRLSYPDWIVERLRADLGAADADLALSAMNEPAAAHVRADGYVQDPASQQVAELVGTRPGELVADLCAAPGGKSTLVAGGGPALVTAADVHPGRAALIVANAARTNTAQTVAVVAADARRPPHRPATFDRVLVDAPCTGLGVLRRRPDARWRVGQGDVEELAALQRDILDGAAPLVRPGGTLVYSVCTLTAAETTGIDHWLADAHPELVAVEAPGPPWRPLGRGALLVPHAAGTDGMYVLRLTDRAVNPG